MINERMKELAGVPVNEAKNVYYAYFVNFQFKQKKIVLELD